MAWLGLAGSARSNTESLGKAQGARAFPIGDWVITFAHLMERLRTLIRNVLRLNPGGCQVVNLYARPTGLLKVDVQCSTSELGSIIWQRQRACARFAT